MSDSGSWSPERDLANKITAYLKDAWLIKPIGSAVMKELEESIAQLIRERSFFTKARGFDILIKDLAAKLPPEAAIRKLSGLSLAEAFKDCVIVSRREWEMRGKPVPAIT